MLLLVVDSLGPENDRSDNSSAADFVCVSGFRAHKFDCSSSAELYPFLTDSTQSSKQ